MFSKFAHRLIKPFKANFSSKKVVRPSKTLYLALGTSLLSFYCLSNVSFSAHPITKDFQGAVVHTAPAKTIKVCITGAAGQIGYAFIPLLLTGQVFGREL